MKDDTPFILECSSCRTRYEIPVSIPEGGRKVRCANCSHIWVAQPQDVVRVGEEPLFLENAAQEVVFRDVKPEPGPEPEPEPEADGPADADVSEKTPADKADAGEDVAISDAAVVEAGAGEGETSADDPRAFAAAVAQAGAETQTTDGFKPIERDVEFTGGEDFAAPSGADEAGEAVPTIAAAEAGEAGPDEGAAEEGGPADEVAAFYGEAVAAPAPPKVGRAKRKAARGRLRTGVRPGLAAGWAALLLAVGGIAYLAVTQRVEVVRLMPGSARLYEAVGLPVNIRGLDFRDVAYSWETEGGQVVLEVHGDIVNLTSRPLDVPTLILGLRDGTQREVHRLEEKVMTAPLGAGDSATFAVRIPTPPRSIKSVQVRFANAR